MKRIALLLAVFCLGLLAASFAFADNGGGKGKGRSETESTSTSSSGDKKKCHNVSLKGTAPATTFTITVEKANHAGRDLKSATLTFSGKVNVNAVLCSGDSTAAGPPASTLKLRNMKVAKAESQGSGD